MTVGSSWTEIAQRKRAQRDAIIQKHLALPPDTEIDLQNGSSVKITDIGDIAILLKLQQEGRLSAEQIITAYIKRACEVQELLCFDEAISRARELDQYRQASGTLIGPFHGIPISLKDQFDVTGLDSSLGYVGRTYSPAVENAQIVDTLLACGGVIFAKTNLPQSIMWCETENPLWGLTTHPLNAAFTPGGSTGGEGALLSMHGSIVGLGTDLGGSIRIPSHMNGLWGLKPSSNRLSYKGVSNSTEGQQHVPSSVGPMSRTFDTLLHITKTLIEKEPWRSDPICPPLPWREDVFQETCHKSLVVAILANDGVVHPHPPFRRVLNEYESLCKAAGFELVTWSATLHSELISIMDAYYTADGCEDLLTDIRKGGEPMIPRVEELVQSAPAISVYEYWQLNKRKVAAQRAYHVMWENIRSPSGRSVDVLLLPTMPHTAVPHRKCRWVGYTKVFNILDYTAISFPAGKASKRLDAEYFDAEYSPRNKLDADNWALYDPDNMEGLPVGLQIVGRRFEEEKVLAVASRFDAMIREQNARG